MYWRTVGLLTPTEDSAALHSALASPIMEHNTDCSVLHRKQNNHLICLVPKTVLIADDSAAMRLSVRLLLEGRHTDLTVREAVDGLDAIEKVKKSKPDLILLDLAMPQINGAEAAAVLKNDLPETPVILFTMTELHVAKPSTLISFRRRTVFRSC